MTYLNTICMNGGENCGCAGHCPYWESNQQNTEQMDDVCDNIDVTKIR